MWGAWFGGQTAQKRKDAPKKAILDLRQQLDMLQKRERHLENQMAQQDKIARENVGSNKTGEFWCVCGFGALCCWVMVGGWGKIERRG